VSTPPTEQITAPLVDATLLDGAVLWLNRATQANGIQLAISVSQYILDTFFGGDFRALSSKDPHKTASFRALCEREDLELGASTLHRLVRIGHQARHLPADLAESLSIGHHRALLAVESAPHKQHLARLAVERGWTAEKLEATIAAEHPQPEHRPGRPKKAPVLKWLTAVRREVKAQADIPAFAWAFQQMQASEQASAKAGLHALRQDLEALWAAVDG